MLRQWDFINILAQYMTSSAQQLDLSDEKTLFHPLLQEGPFQVNLY